MTATIKSLILNVLYVNLGFIFSTTSGLNIKLYKDINFTDILAEYVPSAECNNIPKYKREPVFSISSDTNFIAYRNLDCAAYSSMKYTAGSIHLSESDLRDIESFIPCNEEEGGNQLNLDITEFSRTLFLPDVLQTYRNVCSCVNVPDYVQNMSTWAIDNHHNDLWAYFESNCTENNVSSHFIAAGQNKDSRHAYVLEKTDGITDKSYKIQSFGPDTNSTYYQISCNSSYVKPEVKPAKTEVKKTATESGTQSVKEVGIMEQIKILTNKITELQKQVYLSEQIQSNLQNGTESILQCSCVIASPKTK